MSALEVHTPLWQAWAGGELPRRRVIGLYGDLFALKTRLESEETVRATAEWLLAVEPDDFDATVITTYPGTPYFDEAVETKPGVWTYSYPKTGDRLHSIEVDYREVAEYYKGVPGEYTSYVYTDHLNSLDLVRLRDWLEGHVREKLAIPYNAGAPAVRYEHSMGQFGQLPRNILRQSTAQTLEQAHSDVRNRWIPLAER